MAAANERAAQHGETQGPYHAEPASRESSPREAEGRRRPDYCCWTLEELRWLAAALGGDPHADRKSHQELIEFLNEVWDAF
jgi:hypothetical protein